MRFPALFLATFVVWGCATVPKSQSEPQALLDKACGPAANVRETQGSLWIKAKSKEASGQFPAALVAQAPSTLKLEVTNLIGGTEALITVQGEKIVIQDADGNSRSGEGSSWGGIPLHWATELFLGRIPCPTDRAAARLSKTPDGLVVESGTERFEYRFRNWGGSPWPEKLRWTQGVNSVDFKFDDPDDQTASPKKWEAKSSLGEVKVRWKDRKFIF